MIDIKTAIYILAGFLTIGGAIVGFFSMQTRQNMKIEQLEKDLSEVKDKQAKATHYQIDTEKAIIRIEEKIDMLVSAINDIKEKECGRNC